MKKHFEFYWPIFNLLGIVLVLWSLSAINVNPENVLKIEALLDSTHHDKIYQAELKEGRFLERKNDEVPSYQLTKRNTRLVVNF